MFRWVRCIVASCAVVTMLAACDAASSSSAPHDAASVPASRAPAADTAPDAAPPALSVALAQLDPADPGAFEAALDAFGRSTPPGSTALEEKAAVDELVPFVRRIAEAVEAQVRRDEALTLAACASASSGCADAPSEPAQAALQTLLARGVRFDHAGEGTFRAVADLQAIADGLGETLSEPARAVLLALDATARAEQHYDEGGYAGDPDRMAKALLQWEQVAAEDESPWATDVSVETSRVREAYLRLCDHGEWERPPCRAREPLRDSYASFVEDHPDSPSSRAVEVLYEALQAKRWKATAEQLDAMVSAALAAES